MSRTLPRAAHDRRPAPAILSGVAGAVATEQRLLKELTGVLEHQRAAVLTSDLGTVEDSIFAVRRILLTVNAVRAKRRSLNRLMDEPDDLSVWELEEVLGKEMTEELRQLCTELDRTARRLSREVEANHHLLAAALRTAGPPGR